MKLRFLTGPKDGKKFVIITQRFANKGFSVDGFFEDDPFTKRNTVYISNDEMSEFEYKFFTLDSE